MKLTKIRKLASFTKSKKSYLIMNIIQFVFSSKKSLNLLKETTFTKDFQSMCTLNFASHIGQHE